jgi:serine/threonine protein kinase
MELPAGTRVGPYEIDRKIGAGGMGVVYGARDDRLGRQVAIKVLPAAVIGDADRLRRFEQEARTVGGLNHPNLVILHDVGRHEGAPYIVTELLTGQSLRARIAEGAMSLREVVRIAVEIARGLNAAHGSNIVHRDIKPDNIFVTRDSRVKILDFGIAKLRGTDDAATAATAATGSGVVVGTPGYMAPEQLRGGTIDARTDLFALGVVIFEMLARRRPFTADTHVEESYQIMKGAPHALPAGMPGALSKIVMRCLEKRPDDRFQSAADLAFALDALDDVASGRLSTPLHGVPIRAQSEAFAETATSAPQLAVATGTAPGTSPATGPTTAPATGPTTAAATGPTTEPPGTRPLSVVSPPSTIAPAARSRKLVIGLAAACVGLGALAGAGWLRKRGTPDQFPSRVTGGPAYERVSWHTQQKWFARFDAQGDNVLFSRRIYDTDGQKQKSDWEVVRSAPGASTVLKIDKLGRVLDVDRKTGELALRLSDQGEDGGLLARAMIGGADPRPVTDRVKDAAWLPSDELVILRADDQGNTIEYPIDHPLVKPHGREMAALRASRDSKLGVIEHLAFDDSAGRVAIYRLDGVELAHSHDYPGIEGIAFAPNGELYFSTNDTIRSLAANGKERVVMRSYGRVQLRDIAADGRLLLAPSDTRYRMYRRINPDQGVSRDEPVEWLDESVAKSLSAKGDAIAFLQIADPGHTAEGWAVFLRKNGDTTQIGNAYSVALVPDGSAAVLLCGVGAPLRVVPIPMGGTRTLDPGPIKRLDLNDWIAVSGDGTHAALRGAGADGEMRLWLVDLAGKSAPVPVGPQSVGHGHHPLSADSEWIALAAKEGIRFVSTSGKPEKTLLPSPTAGLSMPTGPFEPLEFSEDDHSIIFMNLHSYPRVIMQMSLETGETHELWRFDPPDRPRLFEAAVAADASAMVYSISFETSDLYVVAPPKP